MSIHFSLSETQLLTLIKNPEQIFKFIDISKSLFQSITQYEIWHHLCLKNNSYIQFITKDMILSLQDYQKYNLFLDFPFCISLLDDDILLSMSSTASGT